MGRRSGFVWEIVRNVTERPVVGRSSVSYSSMEEAIIKGKWRSSVSASGKQHNKDLRGN